MVLSYKARHKWYTLMLYTCVAMFQPVAVDKVVDTKQLEPTSLHFTRWQDALPFPDATAPFVAEALDSRVFCYIGLPEQIHSYQGAQF